MSEHAAQVAQTTSSALSSDLIDSLRRIIPAHLAAYVLPQLTSLSAEYMVRQDPCVRLEVTPAFASAALSRKYTGQRRQKAHVIQRMAKNISQNNTLSDNPQTISFNSDGDLIDGQHRLEALVQSGVSAQMRVVFSVPGWVYGYIDSEGAGQRLPHERLLLASDLAINARLVKAVRAYLTGAMYRTQTQIPLAEIAETYAKYRSGFDYIDGLGDRALPRNAQIRAALSMYAALHPEMAAAFMRRFMGQAPMRASDPAHALLMYLGQHKYRGVSADYWYATACCRGDLSGKPMLRAQRAMVDLVGNTLKSEQKRREARAARAAATRKCA